MSKGKVKARGYIVSAVKREGWNLLPSERDEFDVIDFNAGATLQDNFGNAFDNARLSDPVVAQTVLHLIKSRAEMTVLLPAGLASEKFLAAYYEKKTLPWVSIVVWKSGGRGIIFANPSVAWGAREFSMFQ
jgi:hypothetical protein